MKKVAVLYGGWSAEREVSLVSGASVAKGLEEAGYKVSLIDVSRDLSKLLTSLTPKPDAVFNALHGQGGEDGTIQAILNMLQIPYTHSGMTASSVAMDKVVAKKILITQNIPVPEGKVASIEDILAHDVLPRPYVVKPVAEGSSVGVRIVRDGDNHPPIDKATWQFGKEALVEKYIPGREITVAVMGDKALGVTEIIAATNFYDYEAKYAPGGSRHVIPAEIKKQDYDQAMELALQAHQALGCRGVSRTDLRLDDTKAESRMYVLEVNTQPGMTPTSLVPEQAAYLGISFPQLVSWMVENAACDF
ncbi:MAG: D-alanine--D-alanine ligase [Dongiaceae bacterium]